MLEGKDVFFVGGPRNGCVLRVPKEAQQFTIDLSLRDEGLLTYTVIPWWGRNFAFLGAPEKITTQFNYETEYEKIYFFGPAMADLLSKGVTPETIRVFQEPKRIIIDALIPPKEKS